MMELLLPDLSHPLIRGYFLVYYGMLGLVVLLGQLKWNANWPERIMVLVFATSPLLQAIGHGTIAEPKLSSVDWIITGIDIYLLGATLLLAFNADRWWPYFAAPCLIYSLLAHIPRLAYQEWLGSSYVYLNVLSTLMAVFFLFCGSVSYFRKRRRGEEQRDWVPYGKMGLAWKSIRTSPTITALRKSL